MIPQINADQVLLLKDMCGSVPAISQCIPDEAKDGKTYYEEAMDKLRDTEQLVILGLLKEVSEENNMKLAEIFSMTGRRFRVFEITDVGKAMFSGTTRTIH